VSVDQCVDCDAGYERLPDAQDCTPCGIGKYKPIQTEGLCELCPGGKYQPNVGQVSCESCHDGQYPDDDHIFCSNCPAGYYVENISKTNATCNVCPSGQYAPSPQSKACLSCQAGYSTLGYSQGATACAPCNGGTYSSVNSINCSFCPIGKFSGTGEETCTQCESGKYSEKENQAYCLACSDSPTYGPEYTSYPGASKCTGCLGSGHNSSLLGRGYYYDNTTSQKVAYKQKKKCHSCSRGMDCSDDFQELSSLQLEKGWYRFSTLSTEVYECPIKGSCNAPMLSATSITQVGIHVCDSAYKGPLCSVCNDNYGYSSFSVSCEKCLPSLYLITIGWAFCGLMIFVLIGVIIYYCYQYFHLEEWYEKNKLFANLRMAQFSTFLITVQTGILINDNQESAGGKHPPMVFEKFQNVLGFLNLNYSLIPVGCFAQSADYFTVLIIQTLLLILIPSLFAGLWWYSKKTKERNNTNNDLRREKDYASYGIFIMKFFLPTVSLTIGKGFRCVTYDNEKYIYLLEDMSINCNKSYYQDIILPYAVTMMVLLPFGVTCFTLIILYQIKRETNLNNNKNSISGNFELGDKADHYSLLENDDNVDKKDIYVKNNSINQKGMDEGKSSPFVVLFYNVKDEYWYVEVVDMLRRLMLTCFPIIFTNYGPVLLFSLVIALISLVYQQETRPYLLEAMNTTKMIESYQNLLVVIVLLIQDTRTFSNSKAYQLAGITLVCTNLLMILIMFQSLTIVDVEIFKKKIYPTHEDEPRTLKDADTAQHSHSPFFDENNSNECFSGQNQDHRGEWNNHGETMERLKINEELTTHNAGNLITENHQLKEVLKDNAETIQRLAETIQRLQQENHTLKLEVMAQQGKNDQAKEYKEMNLPIHTHKNEKSSQVETAATSDKTAAVIRV